MNGAGPAGAVSCCPPCDVPEVTYDRRPCCGKRPPRLPEIAEVDLGRHYTELAKQTHG